MPFCLLSRVPVRTRAKKMSASARVRRPDLLPVDDVLVAVAAGGGAQARQVRACLRLGVALGPDRVAAQHRGEPALLLLLGAVLDDGGRGDVQAGAERSRHPGPGHFLVVDHLVGERQLHAAELARPAGARVPVVEQGGQPRLGPGQALARVFRRPPRVMGGEELPQPGAEGIVGLRPRMTVASRSRVIGVLQIPASSASRVRCRAGGPNSSSDDFARRRYRCASCSQV